MIDRSKLLLPYTLVYHLFLTYLHWSSHFPWSNILPIDFFHGSAIGKAFDTSMLNLDSYIYVQLGHQYHLAKIIQAQLLPTRFRLVLLVTCSIGQLLQMSSQTNNKNLREDAELIIKKLVAFAYTKLTTKT